MSPRRTWWLAAVAAFATGCASVPPPDVLAQLEGIASAPSSQEAKRYAPSAHAHATRLRERADEAFASEQHASAQILGEQAVAAFARAHALARVARAENVRVAAEADGAAAAKALAKVEASFQRVDADVRALERKLDMLRSLEPLRASGDARHNREKARLAATRSLALEARLLCEAAALLQKRGGSAAAGVKAVGEARKALDALDAQIAKGGAAPIDGAMRARAGCLGALTGVRRAIDAKRSPDALLGKLSGDLAATKGVRVRRDDRGVAVSFPRPAAAKKGGAAPAALSNAHAVALSSAAAIAKSFGAVALVVVHDDGPPNDAAKAAAKAQGETLRKRLVGAGLKHVDVQLAGEARPVVDPTGPHRADNARFEVVFVTAAL